jgi:hypothetical protein
MSARRRVRLLVTASLATLLTIANVAIALAGDGAGPLPK